MMLLYAICLFVFAALEIMTGVLTYHGKYEVVYDYYISKVNDLQAYTKAQGIATMTMAAPALIAGVLFLLKPTLVCGLIGIAVVLLGIIGGFIAFDKIQKKYNDGMF